MPAIEVDIWGQDEKNPGYIKRISGRPIRDVAKDIENLLDKSNTPCDYWSDQKHPPIRDKGTAEFPCGHVYLRLEVGANEGYRLYVGVERRETPELKVVLVREDVISFKLLLNDDDALKAHNVVFRALMLTR